MKLNYDTGAAVTAFPRSMAPDAMGNGQLYRTATGELTEDAGALRVTGETEAGELRRITGRVTDVHKVLVSAAKVAGFGQDGWISKGGGYLYPASSPVARKVKELLEREACSEGSAMIPLYEENGVYNFYLRTGGQAGKVQVLDESTGAAGFTRQP